jgi:UDPglucose 6-dehydrogenase
LVNIYDPQVPHDQIWVDLQEASPHLSLETSVYMFFLPYSILISFSVVKKQVTICDSALDACKEAEAIVIATEWKEFKGIDWEIVYASMSKPAFVFDGRLLLDAEKLRKIGFKVGLLCFGRKMSC